MIAVVTTTLLVWIGIALIGYILSSMGFRECLVNGVTLTTMLLIGWVPGIIVASDIDNYLDK